MKKLLPTICLALGVYFITGCNKDSSITQPQRARAITSVRDAPDTNRFYIKMTDWYKIQNSSVYTYDFGTLTAPRNASAPPQVDVYILNNNSKIPITTPVRFMNGTIWTVISGLNVGIVYRVEDGRDSMPFHALDVEIVIH